MNYVLMTGWIAALTLAAPAFAEDMPHRKPGLWESTMRSAQMQGRNVTSQQCIDEKSDAEMLKKAMGANEGGKGSDCSQKSSQRTANGFEFDSVCKQGDGTLTSHMTMAGDFNSQYTMEIKGQRTPPRSGTGDFQTTVNSRHLGACPADMKPGDMKINGMLIHADGMPANISPQQAEQMKKMMEQMKKQMAK